MAESYSWIFVDFVPLLYERHRVAKQFKIETWLDLSQLLEELKLEIIKVKEKYKSKMEYVI